MVSRALVGESRLRTQRRKQQKFLYISICGGMFFVVTALIALAWLPALRIKNVIVEGAETVSADEVAKATQGALLGTYGHVLPKINTFIYPRETLENTLRSNYPLFADVSVRRQGATLVVSVIERQAKALWCAESENQCFFMDASGVVYGPSGTTSPRALVQYGGPVAGTVLPKQFMNPQAFNRLALLVDAMSGLIGTSTSVLRVALNEEGDAEATLNSGCVIRFSIRQDTAVVLQHLTLALASKPFTTTALSQVAYIDLRFGQKLYYKLK